MNRTFKTVWNKFRRALMVVNEATSACQRGASKALGGGADSRCIKHRGFSGYSGIGY